ncbi:type IV pilus modification protein PilV [Pseudoxanthomonas dokdonensis]|uniref:Type IV pilus modification protein PilV n=1 Tax=Pseudoxanthomonas dokdonensis TaxID=344882 RepID=A0A0R0CIU5_9GAMM|nr:type IV pilus modification protein PilV [Pseudoxanthomonas dokdonensis]KRG69158.1 hypothetical protein ABB29_12225 [Pseudoxanthomonas dokdonensis]
MQAHKLNRSCHAPRAQRGASLLEVMIAVLIMGIGLLGIAAMQTTALRNNQSSMERSQAVIQAYSILEAMRANREEAVNGGYDMALTCAPPAGASLVNKDQQRWISDMQDNLTLGAGACGAISCPANSACTITVQWDDSRATGLEGQGINTESISVTTLI